jgi:inner membrane protein
MEPITHLLTGACMGRAGLNRSTAYAMLMLTLGAEFPDIDVLWSLKGPVAGLAHHRGFTHSLIGAPVDSAIILAIVYAFHRWQKRHGRSPSTDARWGLLFLFGILATLSHILLDFTNNYGVRPFLPFNWHWYSWDIVWIVEPLILLALILGLLVPSIFALVGTEIGARQEKFHGRWSATAALLAICGIWWVRDFQHRKAVTLLTSTDYRGEVVQNAAALPYPVNPFAWAGVVETPSFYAKVPIDSYSTSVDQLDRAQILYKSPPTPVTFAARRSPLGRAYLDWSRFPLVTTQASLSPDQAYVVRLQDLRFDYPAIGLLLGQRRERPPLSADVVLDKNLHVMTMRMGNQEQKP